MIPDGYTGSMKKKRAFAREVKEKSITQLYRRLCESVMALSELLEMQSFTDTTILKVDEFVSRTTFREMCYRILSFGSKFPVINALSSLGVSPFFVENVSELQLSCLKLVTVIFSRYDQHRRLLLDDILASIARLPSSKRGLRTYRLRNSEETIQMVTALVLQLIQCVINLPTNLQFSKSGDHQVIQMSADGATETEIDIDVFIGQRYEKARQTAANFLTVFLSKCTSKGEEGDYRPLFENFVQDLLATVNKPDWPASEFLLSLLGFILVSKFSKGKDMNTRVSSLEYLGVIAARLRKDAVTSRLGVETIDKLIAQVKEQEEEQSKETGHVVELPKLGDLEEERTQYLQRLLLEYLSIHAEAEPALRYTRDFYVAQWYVDAAKDIRNQQQSSKSAQNGEVIKTPRRKDRQKKSKSKKRRDDSTSEEEISDDEDENSAMKKDVLGLSETDKREVYRLVDLRKKFLLGKVFRPSDISKGARKGSLFQTELDDDSAELIARYLASKRDFLRSFNTYLRQILNVLVETAIAVRTKAMKCLAMIVEADPSVLERKDVLMGVNHSFLDHSTSVREAAVDLVGRFIISRPSLVHQYYDMLSTRILDTGVSVRKRVIKILKDVCTECPEFPKIPEICVKMIRRVNDEEGIRKLVMEVFQSMWFTPSRERAGTNNHLLVQKVKNIVDVASTCSKANNLEWFEQLLRHMFKPKEDKDDSTKIVTDPPKVTLLACQQIVDCLVENVLLIEECDTKESEQSNHLDASERQSRVRRSSRLAGCMQTLHLFAKIYPSLLLNHGMTLQPYLTCSVNEDAEGQQIVCCTASILEVIVPLMEHPSEPFLAQLEEDVVKLIVSQTKPVVTAAVQCLASIVNRVTKNYSLVKDCLGRYLVFMERFQRVHDANPEDPRLKLSYPYFRRAIFVVGLFMQFFDFRDQLVRCGLEDGVINQTFEIMYYFVNNSIDPSLRFDSLQGMGSMCIRHYEFLLKSNVVSFYSKCLLDAEAPVKMKVQILNNLENYLKEEEARMAQQDKEFDCDHQISPVGNKTGKKENLKEMRDVHSGMASTIMQVYLKPLLESCLHSDMQVRRATLQVVQTIVNQGLVTPAVITDYLIAMSTDSEESVYHTADKLLQELEKKFPSFIQMKVMPGLKLSYILQQKIQHVHPIRGFRKSQDGSQSVALTGFVYSLLRSTKSQRRAIATTFLKQFDEKEVDALLKRSSLASMLYLADNIAFMPFQVLDEPLYIIHQIDVMISLHGGGLLQSFKDNLIPRSTEKPAVAVGPDGVPQNNSYYDDEDEDDDLEALLERVPEDTTALEDVVTTSQGVVLLLILKQHLKETYGLTDKRISEYNPNASGKLFEKTVNRRNVGQFNPKQIIKKLAEMDLFHENPNRVHHEKSELIRQYLDALMLKIDPDQDEEDGDGAPMSTPSKRDITMGQDGPSATRNLFTTPTQSGSVPSQSLHSENDFMANPQPLAPHIIRPNNPVNKTPVNPGMMMPMVPLMRLQIPTAYSQAETPVRYPEMHGAYPNAQVNSKNNSPSKGAFDKPNRPEGLPKLTISLGNRTSSQSNVCNSASSKKSQKGHSSHRKHTEKKKKKKKRHKYSESDTEDSESSEENMD
ncbi:unnamed protein product [Notodromas monacha]|uniref:Nipped-B protein n=1 Tax=Notodromas monacha TaxID=399045 RepID=A0A7R9BQL7_9CRUS|nr:unnamed protein product [Notodromas monacha]CAG0918991.1 unnamed protein product [Notodromas monacha]